MNEIFGGREAQRQQTEKEAGGDKWRGIEITKRRRGRDGEIITDPETEEGIDRCKEGKRQTQPRRSSHRCGERKQGEQEQWARSYLELPASLGVVSSCSLACSPECFWVPLS